MEQVLNKSDMVIVIGVYFTTFGNRALELAHDNSEKLKVLIVAWVATANPYAVGEDPKGKVTSCD